MESIQKSTRNRAFYRCCRCCDWHTISDNFRDSDETVDGSRECGFRGFRDFRDFRDDDYDRLENAFLHINCVFIYI